MASFIRRIVVVIASALLAGSCGDDDPPPGVDYLLCAGVRPGGWIAVFDCINDSLIDSLGYPGMNTPLQLSGSSTGQYITSLESGRPTRVWDLRSGTQASELRAPEYAIFLEDRNLLLTATVDTLRRYRLPGFEIDTAFWGRLWNAVRLTEPGTLLAINPRGPRERPLDYAQLVFFDINTLTLLDSFTVDDGSEPVQVRWIEPSRDGNMVYLLGADWSSPAVFAYSLREQRIVYRTNLFSAVGRCKLSPDQHELWVTDPGPPPTFGEAWPGHVLILNATTGAILDTIHTRGLDENHPDIRWRVDDIQFVPDQNKAYVNCMFRGPILVINTKTKEITKHLLHGEGRSADAIVALPHY